MQAILILAHRDTEQVLRLADKLRQSFEIYIHFDTKLKLSNQEKEALKEKNIHWYQCVEVNWRLGHQCRYHCFDAGSVKKSSDYVCAYFIRTGLASGRSCKYLCIL